MSQAFEVAKHERHPILLGQLAKFFMQLERIDLAHAPGHRQFGTNSFKDAMAARLRMRPPCDTSSNLVQPARQGVAPMNGPRLAGEHQERGLEGILCVMDVAEHPSADSQHHRPVPPDQNFEGNLRVRVAA